MKIKQNRAIYFGIILVFMIMATSTVTSGADVPEFSLILDGNIYVNGEPAPVGTEITVKLNDELVGDTEVSMNGVYGDTPENKLLIVCSSEYYKNLKFYVDGIEIQFGNVDVIRNADHGDFITFNIGVITVDDDDIADFTSIQAAVDTAFDGDTILVFPGTYTENVYVYKELVIKSQSGDSDDTIVQAANPDNHVFNVTADNVTISGFYVNGATTANGIDLNGVEGCTVANNFLSNNYVGIALFSSSYNNLTSNTASNNEYGITMSFSSNNNLTSNTASNNNLNGIVLFSSSKNNLTSNTASNNSDKGIKLSFSSDNNLTSNTANANNYFGIVLWSYSNNNTLTNNTANSNDHNGIYLRSSSNNNTLASNTVSNNYYGIVMWDSSYNNLNSNTANANNKSGIDLWDSSNNLIYNNHFNNTANTGFYETDAGNIWNITKTAGINIIGGPYLGGNYWAKPDGTGFSQTNLDTNGDGFCDSSLNKYELDVNNIDYLPLGLVTYNPYDENEDYVIDIGEVNTAIDDYRTQGPTSIADINELIDMYRSGEPYC
ncbi:hypothetical protein HNV12_24220 [Methanococcoides sp. SA1]|nr:hypothetical protein [Methanococcoides sp. SA1]